MVGSRRRTDGAAVDSVGTIDYVADACQVWPPLVEMINAEVDVVRWIMAYPSLDDAKATN